MTINKAEYNFALDILSHLVLTKPRAVQLLLEEYGVGFFSPPNGEQLIDLVIEFIGEGNTNFMSDLDKVFQMHMQYNAQSLYAHTDIEAYDNWISAAIGAVATIGTTLINNNQKKKARKRAQRQAEAEAKELDELERKNIARKRVEARRIAREKAAQQAKERMLLMRKKQEQHAIQIENEIRKKRGIAMVVSAIVGLSIGVGIYIYKKKKQ